MPLEQQQISIHAPRVGSDWIERARQLTDDISIHAPRVGSDKYTLERVAWAANFNPRSPCGERLSHNTDVDLTKIISIHAPRVGSDRTCRRPWRPAAISIHAPRVGSDPPPQGRRCSSPDFNPRSPCGERLWGAAGPDGRAGFQSTLPVWGATTAAGAPTPPLGFQSTLPVWGATSWGPGEPQRHPISIHAPRVGSDPPPQGRRCSSPDFNPRSPCGERPDAMIQDMMQSGFQSTLPVWGATLQTSRTPPTALFQSTLPVWGATRPVELSRTCPTFQSTLPVWGATLQYSMANLGREFQSTLPVWGATGTTSQPPPAPPNFNPRSPCGERLLHRMHRRARGAFQSTLPVWGATVRWKISPPVTVEFQSTLPVWGATRTASWYSSAERPFQSTLPVWGATRPNGRWQGMQELFQSTLPVWGATAGRKGDARMDWISIHAPRVGSDQRAEEHQRPAVNFNPRSPCGERPSSSAETSSRLNFNPRSPCGERPLSITPYNPPKNFNPRSPCGERRVGRCRRQRARRISIHAPRVGSDVELVSEEAIYADFNPRSPCGERLSGRMMR